MPPRRDNAARRPRLLRAPHAAVAVAALVFSLAAASGAAEAGGTASAIAALVVTGHGLGHGVGLSQWGAEERAAAGETYPQILSFYYPGTTLGTAPGRTIRVLVASAQRLRIGSRAPFAVRDAGGRRVKLAAGSHPVRSGALDGASLRFPLAVLPGAAPLEVGGTRFPGSLRLVAGAGGAVEAVDVLGLEEYVQGVVAAECPGYWPAEALRAQAVASRSYALANLRPGAAFDLYPDDRSQNYRGLARDYPAAAAAAAATRGQVLRYGNGIADAFFSASNGGVTNDGTGLWDVARLPYFAARPDPYDARSPAANWGPVVVPLARLHAAFPELPQALARIVLDRTPAGRAATVTFVAADGTSTVVDGYRFQQRLRLRSTYLSVTPEYDASAGEGG